MYPPSLTPLHTPIRNYNKLTKVCIAIDLLWMVTIAISAPFNRNATHKSNQDGDRSIHYFDFVVFFSAES